jgi:Ca2+-dependent lipid-binding protein
MTETKKSVWGGLFGGGGGRTEGPEPIGELILTVMNAKLLRNTEMVGKMDPYVCVEYRGKKYKTDVDSDGGQAPVWNN